MLFKISSEPTNLKCLQVVEILGDISLLELSLLKLPPLEALYISILEKDGQIDYNCLDKHKGGIKNLVLVTGASTAWKAGSHSILRGSSLRRAKIDFRTWKVLRELTYHCGGDLPTFYLPSSLKFLSVIDSKAGERDLTYTYYDLLRTWTCQKVRMAGNLVSELKAVIIHTELSLPNTTLPPFKLLEVTLEKRVANSRGRTPLLSVKLLTAPEFLRMFPETSLLRSNGATRQWIGGYIFDRA
ncbi:hypothetical protein TWF506_004054 [Arthrobotrys conoides]|uniref:Uncharacterized protein n=1 Tax=Arthrobotrys conoides TaxID=74498 RepID=A0AAN8MXC8_9PEZI